MMQTLSEILSSLENKFKVIEKHEAFIIEAFNIDYSEFLKIQELLSMVVRDGSKPVYICCSHQALTTTGRGDRQNLHLSNQSQIHESIPNYQIKRGGGLTLHHEGQWIFYPIKKLNAKSYTVTDHINWMMKIVMDILGEHWQIEAKCKRNPLGVWVGDQKIASVGVGVNRWVSNHGLALNVLKHPIDDQIFKMMNPCGLNSNIYTNIDEQIGERRSLQANVLLFQKIFLNSLK